MSKILVSYFSASGVTRRKAEALAKEVNGDLFEIMPNISNHDDYEESSNSENIYLTKKKKKKKYKRTLNNSKNEKVSIFSIKPLQCGGICTERSIFSSIC